MKRHTTLRNRLALYFLIVMLVPFVIFISFYTISGSRTLRSIVSDQAQMLIETDAERIKQVIEGYRHKSYLAATAPDIQQMLASGHQPQGDEARGIYSTMYSIMSGDTYLASLSIVSSDGSVRISTHAFPEKYDIRTHSNEWDDTNIISLSERSANRDKQWFISIADHRMENGNQVAFSLLRHIGGGLGYAIIDVYSDALTSQIEGTGFFSDIILLDTSVYQAYSLMHIQDYGSFAAFPELDDTERLSLHPIPETDLVLAGAISTDATEESLKTAMLYMSISLAAGLIVSILLTLLFSRSISKRFSMISSGMKRFEKGDFTTKLSRTGIYEFDSLSITFNTMVKRIEMLVATRQEEEAKAAEAERKALESQMNPHFLFNTLSSIKALARLHGEDEIYRITIRLGKLLRYSIDNHSPDATIRESLEMAESYLMIQRIRFGERLSYEISCPEELEDAITPRLIIQPLAENAIIHGLEGMTGPFRLQVEVCECGSRLRISVKDNGAGFEPPENLTQLEREGHTGLYNIKRRLELRYGSDFSLSISSRMGEGTEIVLLLPLEKEGNA